MIKNNILFATTMCFAFSQSNVGYSLPETCIFATLWTQTCPLQVRSRIARSTHHSVS